MLLLTREISKDNEQLAHKQNRTNRKGNKVLLKGYRKPIAREQAGADELQYTIEKTNKKNITMRIIMLGRQTLC